MTIRFGPFSLDPDTRLLVRGGRTVHLESKAFDLLSVLLLERPKVVSKAALQERLWPATFVAEANVSNLIADIRRALGDRAAAPTYIRTVHGHGYAFVADATSSTAAMASSDPPPCWLEWGARRFPLSFGAHIIGRDADVDVRLDAATVSRRHARLVVSADHALIEDCVSKNGTFRGGTRVTTAVELTHGDALHIGSQLVTFHARKRSASTVTQELAP